MSSPRVALAGRSQASCALLLVLLVGCSGVERSEDGYPTDLTVVVTSHGAPMEGAKVSIVLLPGNLGGGLFDPRRLAVTDSRGVVTEHADHAVYASIIVERPGFATAFVTWWCPRVHGSTVSTKLEVPLEPETPVLLRFKDELGRLLTDGGLVEIHRSPGSYLIAPDYYNTWEWTSSYSKGACSLRGVGTAGSYAVSFENERGWSGAWNLSFSSQSPEVTLVAPFGTLSLRYTFPGPSRVGPKAAECAFLLEEAD